MATITLDARGTGPDQPTGTVDGAATAVSPQAPSTPATVLAANELAPAPATVPGAFSPELAAPASVSAVAPQRVILPEGAFIGRSNNQSEESEAHDDMVLQLRRDPNGPGYFAVLSEYSRSPTANFLFSSDRGRLTDDVLRMQSFYIEHDERGRYQAFPLTGNTDGELVVDRDATPHVLQINRSGDMAGARFFLRPSTDTRMETVEFDGSLSVSSWEPFRPERYFLSMTPGAADYGSDSVNSTFSNWGTEENPDYRVQFSVTDRDPSDGVDVPHIEGTFQAVEQGPGVFVMVPTDPNSPGVEHIAGRLLVFFDLVNWKPFMTTNEAFIIDPADPTNVFFFYERHNRPTDRLGLVNAVLGLDTFEHIPRVNIPLD